MIQPLVTALQTLGASIDSPSIPWRWLIAISSVAEFLFLSRVDHRQLNLYKTARCPKVLEGIVEPEDFKRTSKYRAERLHFAMFKAGISLAQLLLFVYFNVYARVYNSVDERTGFGGYRFLTRQDFVSIIAFFVLNSVDTLISIPFAWYSNFWIEEKYGFNKMTHSTFVSDTIKDFILSVMVLSPLIQAILLRVVDYFGDQFFFYITIAVTLIVLVFTIIKPKLIDPIFNKFHPLEQGELRTEIEKLATQLKFPCANIFVQDGSRRSNHGNAYFIGFLGQYRIVIFDTLINDCSTDEVVGVLAHELGHWYKNHLWRMMFMSALNVFVLSTLFSILINNQSFYVSFGFSDRPVSMGVLLFLQLITPINVLIKLAVYKLIRFGEYEADKFAVDLGKGPSLRGALRRLQKSNLDTLVVDPLYSMVNNSHPIFTERLLTLDSLEEEYQQRIKKDQ